MYVGMLLAQLPNTLRRIRSYKPNEYDKLCIGTTNTKEHSQKIPHVTGLELQSCTIPHYSEYIEGEEEDHTTLPTGIGGGKEVVGGSDPKEGVNMGIYFNTILRDRILVDYYTPHDVYNELVQQTSDSAMTRNKRKGIRDMKKDTQQQQQQQQFKRNHPQQHQGINNNNNKHDQKEL